MENLRDLAGLAAVMVLSLPLALGLVWLSVLGAFQLMPNSPRPVRATARLAPEVSGGLRWAVANSKGSPRAFKAGLDR